MFLKPLNILMIATSFPKYAGEMTAPFIEEIAAAVVARGHRVHLVLPDHPELKRGNEVRGIQIHRYHYAPHPTLSVWGYAAALQNDVIMRKRATLVAPIALGSAWLKIEQLLKRESFDLIHAHWVIPNGFPAWLAASRHHLPLVISTHGSDISVAERSTITAMIARMTMRYAQAITAPSQDLTTRAAALGAIPERLHVLPYCVDPVQFQPDHAAGVAFRIQHGVDADTPLLFSVGRMVEKKGFIYLIRAFVKVLNQHPNAKLMLGGYGEGQAILESEAHRLGIAHAVMFPGAIGHDVINAALNAATIFVLPSVRDQRGNVDGLPNTLLEAMGAGRPIVASRIAGVPAVIEHEQHGLLVPPTDVSSLADAINRLLDQPDYAMRLGMNARARVEHELTWDKYAVRLEDVAYRRTQNQ